MSPPAVYGRARGSVRTYWQLLQKCRWVTIVQGAPLQVADVDMLYLERDPGWLAFRRAVRAAYELENGEGQGAVMMLFERLKLVREGYKIRTVRAMPPHER